MRLIELSDATSFLSRSSAFLLEREAENNLLLSSALVLARASATRSPRLSFFSVEENGKTICAGLNSAGRRMLVSTARDEAATFMGKELASRDLMLKGVMGPGHSAISFCEGFGSTAGRTFSPRYQQSVMSLEALREQPKASGLLRAAKDKDLKLLMSWSRQFVDECGIDERPEETEEMVRKYLENRQLFLWEDTRPVAMAGFGGQTPNGVRVNMVYTDPTARGKRYALSIVQTLSHRLLGNGHRFCFLFVDKANPAANRIYEKLGYKHVGDFTELRLSQGS